MDAWIDRIDRQTDRYTDMYIYIYLYIWVSFHICMIQSRKAQGILWVVIPRGNPTWLNKSPAFIDRRWLKKVDDRVDLW